MAAPAEAGAFAGVRMVDCTRGIAGSMACMLLADFGAGVIRVEPPAGDRISRHPGYVFWNRNKRSIVLDATGDAGRRDLLRLLGEAGVAVFDTLPGELDRRGLDYETLAAHNPGLLHVWLPPYAATGRWSQLPPDELLLQAVSGVAQLQYSIDDRPVALVTPQLSYAHAAIAANAIAAGLLERTRSGRGQALTVSGLNAVAAVEMAGAIDAPGIVRGKGSSLGLAPHYRLYRCADGGWLFLGSLVAPFFLKALDVLDLLDVMAMEGVDGEFTNLLRPQVAGPVVRRLVDRFAERPRAEWLALLRAAGVPAAPVGDRDEFFHGETVAANDMRLVAQHHALGPVEMPGIAISLSDTPGSFRHFLADGNAPPDPQFWGSLSSETADALGSGAPKVGGQGANDAPLAGIRILDAGGFIAGTYAATLLANFGADVIKIEAQSGDPFRPYGLAFFGSNIGKRGLAIDLKAPEGRAAFYDLVRQSDVVLDNFRVGVRARLGIDYATLKAINPRIITCSVTAFGTSGPLALEPGFDPLVQARSGIMAAQGGDDEPVFHQIAVNDTATSMIAAFGILAALFARERTGRGQEVQTSLANQGVLFQSGELTRYEGAPPPLLGGRDYAGPSAARRLYACADGWLAVSCATPDQAMAMLMALGCTGEGVAAGEAALWVPPNDHLVKRLGDALGSLGRDEALNRLAAAGVPAAPAPAVQELFDDPWLRENGFFRQFDDPAWGTVTCIAGYAGWSRTPAGFPRRAPALGEHSVEILRDFGVDEPRIKHLLATGVVVQAE